MTNKEAIKILEVAQAECEWNAPLEYQEAFKVAIEALKAQDVSDKNLPSAQSELSTEIQEILNYLDTTLHPIVSPDNWYVYSELHDMVSRLQSAQIEQSNASEFWRKRADYYSDMCMNLIGEMVKGVKIESVKICENGIEFIKEQPSEQPDGIPIDWINKHLDWLDNCDNDFAQLAKVGIRAMVELWKKDRRASDDNSDMDYSNL